MKQQINDNLIKAGHSLQDIETFFTLLDSLQGKLIWKPGRWTDEARQKQSEIAKRTVQRRRENAEFIIDTFGETEQIFITGWDALLKITGLKETALRNSFARSKNKNLIECGVTLNGEWYQGLIQYKGV